MFTREYVHVCAPLVALYDCFTLSLAFKFSNGGYHRGSKEMNDCNISLQTKRVRYDCPYRIIFQTEVENAPGCCEDQLSINQTSVTEISPAKPGSVARQETASYNHCNNHTNMKSK